jgi:hypothetical protein
MVARLHKRSLLLGVIVPLALLAGQVSTVVHSMVVEHERCLEHGELVHRVVARAHPIGHQALPATSADIQRSHLTPGAATERHGHDHCLSLGGRRDGLRPPAQPSAAIRAALQPWISPPTTPRLDARNPLFLLAPKTSPPAAAV